MRHHCHYSDNISSLREKMSCEEYLRTIAQNVYIPPKHKIAMKTTRQTGKMLSFLDCIQCWSNTGTGSVQDTDVASFRRTLSQLKEPFWLQQRKLPISSLQRDLPEQQMCNPMDEHRMHNSVNINIARAAYCLHLLNPCVHRKLVSKG